MSPVVRGRVEDRPWGKTLGTLARRGVTGELTVRSHNARFQIAFDHGLVVAAASSGSAEHPVALAYRQGVITEAQAAAIRGDDWAQLATLLPAATITRLRRQVIAACVARTFVFGHGEFTFEGRITLPVAPGTAAHVGGMIFHGARTYLGEQRLADGVRALGSRFLAGDRDELRVFAFGPPERAIADAVIDGTSASLLDAIEQQRDRRTARAVVYALATCGVMACEGYAITSGPQSAVPRMRRTARIAEGTPPPALRPMSVVEASLAAFSRGEAALRAGNLDEAVPALERANQLMPEDLEVRCTLAWARFRAAGDAPAARAVLRHAIEHGEHPALAHYFLGLVEQAVGNAEDARAQFACVLVIDPDHGGALRQVT